MILSPVMPTHHIVMLLIAERDRLNAAIEVLGGTTKRRGRPPGSKNGVSAVPIPGTPAKQGRRTFTAAQRKKQAQRMKEFWAKRRKEAGKKS